MVFLLVRGGHFPSLTLTTHGSCPDRHACPRISAGRKARLGAWLRCYTPSRHTVVERLSAPAASSRRRSKRQRYGVTRYHIPSKPSERTSHFWVLAKKQSLAVHVTRKLHIDTV